MDINPVAASIDDNEEHFPIIRASTMQMLPRSWRIFPWMQWSFVQSMSMNLTWRALS